MISIPSTGPWLSFASKHSRAVQLTLALGIPTLVLAPSALATYGWSDDYGLLLFADPSEAPSAFAFMISDARPLMALLFRGTWQFVSQTSDLTLIRLLGVLGLVLSAAISARLTASSQTSKRLLGGFAIGVAFCLPTFQIYAQWATAWTFSWSIFVALLGYAAFRARQNWYRVIGVLLVAAGFAIYPVTPFFIFAVLALRVVLLDISLRNALRLYLNALKLVLVSVAAFAVILFALLNVTEITLTPKVRPVGPDSLLGNIAFFLSRHLPISAHPFYTSRPTLISGLLISLPLGLAIAWFLIRQSRLLGERSIYRLAMVAIIVVTTGAPLLVSGRFVDHRYLPGLSWSLCAIGVVSLAALVMRLLPASRARPVLLFSGILCIVFVFWQAAIRFEGVLVKSYRDQTSWLASEIAECPADAEIFVIRTAEQPWPKIQQIGSLSEVSHMAQPWVIKPAVTMTLNDLGVSHQQIWLSGEGGAGGPLGSVCTLELSRLQAQLNSTTHPTT